MSRYDLIKDYFDDFVAAFATFNGACVASRFTVPYLARGAAGKSLIHDSLKQVSDYFQSYLDDYKSRGCTHCRYENLEISWLGAESAIASVRWVLMNASDATVASWSESYLLWISGDAALAYASVDHIGT